MVEYSSVALQNLSLSLLGA